MYDISEDQVLRRCIRQYLNQYTQNMDYHLPAVAIRSKYFQLKVGSGTGSGHKIGSKLSQRTTENNRDSHYIQYRIAARADGTDMNAIRFGMIQFFLRIVVDGVGEHQVAYIQRWETECIEDNSRRIRFLGARDGNMAIIPLSSIDCSVGKLLTEVGTWIITRSIYAIRNPAEEFGPLAHH